MTISYSDNFWTLLFRWKGSVWKSIWKEILVWLTLYYVIRLIFLVILDDDQQEHAKKVIKIFESFTTKVPLQFLLGFYVGQVVTRWWAQVIAVPWPDEIMVWTNTFFHKDDQKTRITRRCIARYLILCQILVLRNVSTRIRKRFPTVQSLLEAGIITDEEYDLYESVRVENNRWQLPLQWIINGILVPAVNANDIPLAGATTIITKVNDFRNSLRLIYIYDWICIPLVYTQTCSVVVYGYFGICLIGHQYLGQEADLYFPFLTVLQFIFFVGWFKVAQDLMRPFGEDDDDVELNVVLDRHAAVAMAYADDLSTSTPDFQWEKYGDPEKIPYIDDADRSDQEYTPTNLCLPYSKASLKSAKKHDHHPKLHSSVKVKFEDEELIGIPTWIRIIEEESENNSNSTRHDSINTNGKKVKIIKLTNPF